MSLVFTALVFSLPAMAQVLSFAPNAVVSALDDVHVDLRSGMPARKMGGLQIGRAESPSLDYGIFATSFIVSGRTPLYGTRSQYCETYGGVPGCIYSASMWNLNGDSEFYAQTPPSNTVPAGFTEQGSLVSSGGLIRRDGSSWQFSSGGLNYTQFGVVASITYPDGEVLTFNYSSGELRSVVSNTGYMVHLEGFRPYHRDGTARTIPTKVVLINLNTDYCAPLATSCTGLTVNWPSVTITSTQAGNTTTYQAVDNSGRTSTQSLTSSSTTQNGSLQQWTSTFRFTSPEGRWFEYQRLNSVYTTPTYGAPCSAWSTLQWLKTVDGQWDYSFPGVVTGCHQQSVGTGTSTGPDGVTQKWDGNGFVDGLNRKTTYATNGYGSYFGGGVVDLSTVTLPEGNRFDFSYDARRNLTQSSATPKPGAGGTVISASASFSASCTAATAKICNKPTYTIDARGYRTDYTYSPDHGGVLTETLPPDANGIRPEMRYSYQQLSARYKNDAGQLVAGSPIWKLMSISSCRSTASCADTANELITSFTYNDNLLPVTRTISTGNGVVLSVVTTTYDQVGNITSIDGPAAGSNDTTYYFYNAAREEIGQIGPDPDGSGPLPRPATRTTYNLDGQPGSVETGGATGTTLSSLSTMSVYRSFEIGYDAAGRKVRESTVSGGMPYGVTQYSYDVRSRLLCTTQRMNPSAFGSLPADACTLGVAGAYGPDRIARNIYDAAGQLTKVQKAYRTPLQQDYVSYGYSANGKRTSAVDANGNTSSMAYDGFDRQTHWYFPSKTSAGQVSSSDYEQYGYDENSNRTSLRKRDGRTLIFGYDALNRLTLKRIPTLSTTDVYYGYDLRGLQTYARFASPSGQGVNQDFDGLGRRVSSTSTMGGGSRTLSYQYDAHGNRTRLTFPDGNYFTYSYDGLDRMTSILENGSTTVTSLTYDEQGRRAGLAGAVSSSYQYDAVSRLASLTHNLSDTAQDVTLGFTQFNPASQLITRVLSNDSYAWIRALNVNRSYSANGLSQYTAAGSLSFNYDANGNFISDGNLTLTYDLENRLISVSGGKTVQLAYDPLGRLYQTSGGSPGTTQFLYDGDALVAEYDASGNLQRRYVHGSGVDEPLLWYEGGAVSSASRRALRADHQGSIIAVANSAGASLGINRYDEYGVPDSSNMGRFAYTGQIFIPELGMYHYKARVYSPALGRFLQTDPVGYENDFNLYAYVGNDPLNRADPSGEDTIVCNIVDGVVKGCVFTPDDDDTTTVTYEQTNHWTDSEGKTHEQSTSTVVTYEGSISKEGLLSRVFQGQGAGIFESIEQSLSNIIGSEVRLRPQSNNNGLPGLAGAAWVRSLGGLAGQANEKAADVAKSRGANPGNIRQMGHWSDKTLKEVAQGAVNNEPGAKTALKIIKDAGRLSQKY